MTKSKDLMTNLVSTIKCAFKQGLSSVPSKFLCQAVK